jgi:cytochrome c biogenesis protein
MKKLSDKIYDALRSIKLAAILIALIAILSVAGGVIPQGRQASFYAEHFPRTAAAILALGLDKVFTGIPFLAIVAVFTVNLTVCTFHRLARELGKPRRERRHGPDLLHAGLIVFIFGSLLTARTRTEALFFLGRGGSARLPDGATLTALELREERYPDGRPKFWETSLTIGAAAAKGAATLAQGPEQGYGEDFDTLGEAGYAGDGNETAAPAPMASPATAATAATAAAPIAPTAGAKTVRVNSPLRYKGYTIYQQSWSADTRVGLRDPAGMAVSLERGEKAPTLGGFVLYMASAEAPAAAAAPEPTASEAEPCAEHSAIFLVDEGGKQASIKAVKGAKVGPFTFEGFEEEPLSGLKIVRDPGYPLVAAGLALVVLGVFLTYLRRLKGMLA